MSLFHTLEAFVGGISDHPLVPFIGSHTPPYMEKANLDFIYETMGFEIERREIYDTHVPADYIQSGDFFLILRLDGLDPMIMVGTGARGAHCVQALRFDGELYIVESQDAWYWPTKGIQRTPYHKWVQQAKEASFNVIWLPLSAESMLKFNEKAAQEWFFAKEGLPYGYHNFIYGWIDTPYDNFPATLSAELAPVVLSMLNNVIPNKVEKMWIQGLNKRLGTVGLSLTEVVTEAAKRMMSIQDLMAVPEQDGWLYTGEVPRDGESYVCSAFSTSIYKAAGMFGDFEVNATEFTPRDVYMLDFFDKNFQRPQVCIEADPNLPYCQLFGKYRIDVTKELSTIKPYAHMNEHCPSMLPDFFRPDGC